MLKSNSPLDGKQHTVTELWILVGQFLFIDEPDDSP